MTEKFMADLKLTQIWIYPIKSLGGISLPDAYVVEKGLQHDRRWMLVDENGKFMTQRVLPKMSAFKLSMHNTILTVKYKEEKLALSMTAPSSERAVEVQIWDDFVNACETEPQYSAWFSQHLGVNCRLVHFPEGNPRPIDPKHYVSDEQVSLADAYPFLIIGQSSLDDLNRRLTTPVPMNRFRPNFVFTGGAPYEEDAYTNFTIGSTQFAGIKPCARCVLTTVNQDTGQTGDEPLRTLSQYRKNGNKIHFGENLVARSFGTVSVGDSIKHLSS